MNILVIKILAVGLTLSQLFTKPVEEFKSHFDAQADQAQIEQLLNGGCQYVVKEFGAQKINFELIFSMMESNAKNAEDSGDAGSSAGVPAPAPLTPVPATPPTTGADSFSTKSLMDEIDVGAMLAAYRQFCKGEKDTSGKLNMSEVVDYYNKAMENLPDPSKLKGLKLLESTLVLDRAGERFTEVYADNNRRKWVSIKDIPTEVQKAFVAAEDKRFYEHNGIDVRGIIRAFANSMATKDRPQGGSTITQQVVKNLLVGDDLTFERKMREMVLAVRVEKLLSKAEILELYLNFVFLGRASWGVDMASQSYFGHSVRQADLAEAAFLAALTRGPNFYHPVLHHDRLQSRRAYVLGRMKEDGYIPEASVAPAIAKDPSTTMIQFASPHARAAYYFLDEIQRDAVRVAGIKSLTSSSYVVKSTIDRGLQKSAERALQDGLANYEATSGRVGDFEREGTIADDILKYKSTWQEILPKVQQLLFDVQWTLAVNLGKGMVGLADGTTAQLKGLTAKTRKSLALYDLVFVNLTKTGKTQVATLRIRPKVQGAIVVLEAKTGRVLAMAGGFSYALSQLNRVTRTARQPGSTLKPFMYLSALQLGFQPNTLIPDVPVFLAPIDRGGHRWSPKNYDGGTRGLVTIRRAVENSLNLPTARIMSELGNTPQEGLDYIRGVTQELGIYKSPIRAYPFVLGAQPARLLDMAVAYATIANIGMKPTPHFIDSIEQNGQLVYQRPRFSLAPLQTIDRVSFFQIRHILEGTVARGTAIALKDLTGYVAGKTGTSNNENDAWFVGFTNDLVVATWVGYDSKKIRSSLGTKFTGARIALPIAEKVLRESFTLYKDKEILQGAPLDIQAQITRYPINVFSGAFNDGKFPEVFRLDTQTQEPLDTTKKIITDQEANLDLTDGTAVGDEQDAQMDDDVEGIQNQVENGAYSEQDTQSYDPGAEDMYDLWRKNPRKVDSAFLNFKN